MIAHTHAFNQSVYVSAFHVNGKWCIAASIHAARNQRGFLVSAHCSWGSLVFAAMSHPQIVQAGFWNLGQFLQIFIRSLLNFSFTPNIR